MLTVGDMIEKRRMRWEEKHDTEYDRKLVCASAEKLLSEKTLREEILAKPYLLIPLTFCIVDKKRNTVPFFFNDVQADFIDKLETMGTDKPFFILKGRQQGFTSVITAIQLSYAIVRKNFAGFTMADRTDNTMAIFNDKARVVYDRLPELLKPKEKFNSRNEMFFDRLGSSWRIATATEQVGRSRTLNFVHFSEVAFYECDLSALQAGIGEAITAGAIQIYETTANGFNQAKDLWDSGSCHNLFYEWWRSPEYRSNEYRYLETDDPWLIKRIEVLREMGCDDAQIAWYAKKYDGYLDKKLIRQEYPITPEEAFVSSGASLFDTEAINNQLALCSYLPKGRTGFFTYKRQELPIHGSDGSIADVEWSISDIEFTESREGYITLHEEPRVKRNADGDITHKAPYVLAGDTAGTGEDYFSGKVICNLDGKTCATLHRQRIDEDLYAEQMYCLGKYYHDALIGIEINYSRLPTRILQKKYNYPNLYMREIVSKASDTTVMDYGFETNRRTKPIIINELVEIMRNEPWCEPDRATLLEMTTFVKKESGELGAIDGCHDDLVIAKAIAHFIAKKQTADWIEAVSDEADFMEEYFSVSYGGNGNEEYMSWEDF